MKTLISRMTVRFSRCKGFMRHDWQPNGECGRKDCFAKRHWAMKANKLGDPYWGHKSRKVVAHDIQS